MALSSLSEVIYHDTHEEIYIYRYDVLMYHNTNCPLDSGGNLSKFSELKIKRASDSIIDSESIFR